MNKNKKKKNTTKTTLRRAVKKTAPYSFLITTIGVVGGGYLDMANNNTEPRVEGSDPEITASYKEQVAKLSELKKDDGQLYRQSLDVFSSLYNNSQISEADVLEITKYYTKLVAPPAHILKGYVLENPEYLDEAKDKVNSRNLAVLDQKTLELHQKASNDGPWAGAILGFLFANSIFNTTLAILILIGSGIKTGTDATVKKATDVGRKIKNKIKPPKH